MKKFLILLIISTILSLSLFASPETDLEERGLRNILPTNSIFFEDNSVPEGYDYHYHFGVKANGRPQNERMTYFNNVITAILDVYPEAKTYNDYFEEVPLVKFTSSPYSYYTYTFLYKDGNYNVEFSIYDGDEDGYHDYWIDIIAYSDWTYEEMLEWSSSADEDDFDWNSMFGYSDDDWSSWYTEEEEDEGGLSYNGFVRSFFGDLLDHPSEIDRIAYENNYRVDRSSGSITLTSNDSGEVVVINSDGSISLTEEGGVTNITKGWPSSSKLAKLLPEPKELKVLIAIDTDEDLTVVFDQETKIEDIRSYGSKIKDRFPLDQNLEDSEFFGIVLYSLEGKNADSVELIYVSAFGSSSLTIKK
ncbi:MAG: hypothetical protein KBS81_10285 [Spirochaetales bacterium]|nr:hypothetical protein [Candidatus Physcosoma equi]